MGKISERVQRYKLPVIKEINHGDVRYSMVTIIRILYILKYPKIQNKIRNIQKYNIAYLRAAKIVNRKSPHKKHELLKLHTGTDVN